MITIGERIKYLRKASGLTQYDFGVAIGFKPSCARVRIAQYERNYRKPKEDLIQKMATVLNVEPDLLTCPVPSTEREIKLLMYWLYHFTKEDMIFKFFK